MDDFCYTYRVPYADTDQMGVVYYANFFVIFERCRNEFLRETGLTYKKLEESGIMLPVVEAHCSYKSPIYYDDLLSVTASITRVKGCRITISCNVFRGNDLLATGYTIHASVNHSGKPIPAPQPFFDQCDTL